MNGLAPAPLRHSTDCATLEPGFADPVHEAQACFRAVLEAMAGPGRIVPLPAFPAGIAPAPLCQGSAAIALTLCDNETSIWLDAVSPDAVNYLAFHCGTLISAAPTDARFAFVSEADALPPLHTFALGSDEYPERSTTLVIRVSGLGNCDGVRLSGPGIPDEIRLDVTGLTRRFWTERAALNELFPRGLDILFVSQHSLSALPRTTRIGA